jgi:hypothetical protein
MACMCRLRKNLNLQRYNFAHIGNSITVTLDPIGKSTIQRESNLFLSWSSHHAVSIEVFNGYLSMYRNILSRSSRYGMSLTCLHHMEIYCLGPPIMECLQRIGPHFLNQLISSSIIFLEAQSAADFFALSLPLKLEGGGGRTPSLIRRV